MVQIYNTDFEIGNQSPLRGFGDETHYRPTYEGWNFNSGNYLFTTDTK